LNGGNMIRTAALILICSFGGQASAVSYPPGSNVINVVDYGASAAVDAVDDTAAFKAARNASAHVGRIMFVPCGDFIVSDQIEARIPFGSPPVEKGVANWIVHGEGPNGATVRLADNATGFGDSENPRGVFRTCSVLNGGVPSDLASCGGVNAFRNSFHGFAIDLGSGNPGAIGIDYLTNNRGSIADVWIYSSDPNKSCTAGISTTRVSPGPLQFRDLKIDGCKYGILSGPI